MLSQLLSNGQQTLPSVGITCYRAILRWCAWVGDTPFEISQTDLKQVLPEHVQHQLPNLILTSPYDVGLMAKWAFRRGKHTYGMLADEQLNHALEVVRFLYGEFGQDIKRLKEAHLLHSDRKSVQYHVGQVLRHKKFGYKGVVVGWDSECQRAEWANKQSVSPQQPFYHIIPDEEDCVRLFSHAQHIKYVAQENLVNLPYTIFVKHRHLQIFFPLYSRSLGRYIPAKRLQYEYPDNYQFNDLVNIIMIGEEYSKMAYTNSLMLNRDYPEEEDVHISDWYLRKVEEDNQQREHIIWQ
eukprot:TRINITY_DN8531_c0_g2_i1.p1 TRINITY_DN8531_c0_g2~~TRINITY_DN8531_c0_g2_i1.p1  ORF type:complete len:313 (+),score=17.94 TRINITY_DN8531_c0_g2_i1:54-941(+)